MTEQAAQTERIETTHAGAAAALGIAARTLATWKQKGMPFTKGRYDLDAIQEWRKHNLAHVGNAAHDPNESPEQKKRRTAASELVTRLRAQSLARDIRIKDLKLEQLQEGHVARDRVESLFVAWSRRIRGELELLPRAVAREVVGLESLREAEDRVRDAVRQVLGRLSDAQAAERFMAEIDETQRLDEEAAAIRTQKGRPRGRKR